LVVLTGATLAPRPCRADITYTIQNYPSDQTDVTNPTIHHTISGNIRTDGHSGTLGSGDIISWTITIDSTTFTSADTGAHTDVLGTGLSATATTITLSAPSSTDPFPSFTLATETTPGLTIIDGIRWNRNTGQNPFYDGILSSTRLWSTANPSMGMTDPWVIATAGATAVPEPSTAIAAAFGAVAFLAYGWSRYRRDHRRQAAA
jgi:hypothetical protein